MILARAAYDALSDYQKSLVSNYDVLEAAEDKLSNLKEPVDSGNAQTGDSTSPAMCIALMLVSLSAVTALIVLPKKKYS